MNYKRFARHMAAALVVATATPAAALAAPAGMDPAQIQQAIASPISVPAGQTTTVSLPAPVSASYSGGGWEVSAAGTSATVTAPAEGGQISVPVSAEGMNATITLVADPSVSPEDVGGVAGTVPPESGGGIGAGAAGGGAGTEGDPAGGEQGAGNGANGDGSVAPGAASGGEQGSGAGGDAAANRPSGNAPQVPGEKPQRQKASEEDDSNAEFIDIQSRIEGNKIIAELGMAQAMNLYNRFKDTDQEGLKLRYLDGDGQVIEDVKRDIDAGSRTLTLTYPEGQAPDNPFIMQLVRKDGTGVAVQVTLRDPHFAQADVKPGQEPPQPSEGAKTPWWKAVPTWIFVVLGALVLGVLALVGALLKLLASRGKRK